MAVDRERKPNSKTRKSEPERIGRRVPFNRDAEQGVLACCLIGGGEIVTECVDNKLTAEAFYDPAHRAIFEGILSLYKKSQPIEEIVLFNELERMGLAQESGGMEYLIEIAERIETTAHSRYWLEIVKEQYLLRRLIRVSNETIEACFERQGDIQEFLGNVEEEIFSISQDQVTESAKLIREPLAKVMQMVNEYLQRRTPSYGLRTGFTDLDRLTFGLHPSEMVVLAARPSVGKTSLAMNIAEAATLPKDADKEPVPVLVFSLEMSMDQLAMRLLCGRAGVNLNSLRDGFANADDQRKLAHAGRELREAPIHIDDSGHLNILEMRAKARRLKSKEPRLGLVVIDYLQLVSGTDNRVPREQQIAEISRGIKAMAKELVVPVIVLSQLNRESEKEKRDPRMSDLRESGSIEQDADVVLLLHRPKNDEQDENFRSDDVERIRLILAKQRNGPTGVVELAFLRRFTRFENFAREGSGL